MSVAFPFQRGVTVLSTLVVLVAWMLSRPLAARAPEEVPEYPLGIPARFAWIVLAESQDTNDDDFDNDITAIEKVSLFLGYPSRWRIVLRPPTRLKHKDSILREKEDLVSFFQIDLRRQISNKGESAQPEFLVIHLVSHGQRDGSTRWGDTVIAPTELGDIIRAAMSSLRIPIVLILDECNPKDVAAFTGSLSEMERKNLIILRSGASDGLTPVVSFETFRKRSSGAAESWTSSRAARDNFSPTRRYGLTTLNFLAALTGAAPDKNSDGVDLADICTWFEGQGIRGDRTVVCDDWTDSPPDLMFVRRKFKVAVGAFTDLSSFQTDAVEDAKLHERLRSVLNGAAARLHAERWIHVDHCSGSEEKCPGFQLRCQILPNLQENNRSYCLACKQNSDSLQKNSSALEDYRVLQNCVTLEALDRRIQETAELALNLEHSAPNPPAVDVVKDVSVLVLLDQSKSMNLNDRRGAKRLGFFDHVIRLGIEKGLISAVRVVGFSDKVGKPRLCYDARKNKQDVEHARDCWRRLVKNSTRTGTDLIKATEVAAATVARRGRRGRDRPPELVFLVTDGEQEPIPQQCPNCQEHVFLSTCQPHGERVICQPRNRAAYNTCLDRQLKCITDNYLRPNAAVLASSKSSLRVFSLYDETEPNTSDYQRALRQFSVLANEAQGSGALYFIDTMEKSRAAQQLLTAASRIWQQPVVQHIDSAPTCQSLGSGRFKCSISIGPLRITERARRIRVAWDSETKLERPEPRVTLVLEGKLPYGFDAVDLREGITLERNHPFERIPALGLDFRRHFDGSVLYVEIEPGVGYRYFPDNEWSIDVQYQAGSRGL